MCPKKKETDLSKMKEPDLFRALFGKKRGAILCPDLDLSTEAGKREYRRRYMKLYRDQNRKRKYSPRRKR